MKVLITGATDGHGRAVAKSLAGEDAELLLHGRDERRGTALVRAIGEDRATFYRADFASLAEVRLLGERILSEHGGLDVLVNNAGIGTTLPEGGDRMESLDGYELRFQVNYLAGFLLTRLLQPLLVALAPARIVNVTSAGQLAIDFDDVMLEHGYSGVRAYRQSKLAQVMFTFDLAEELGDRQVTANCLHPATLMPTTMVAQARADSVSTLEEGVDATLRLTSDPELEGVTGRYFNGTSESRADPQSYDPAARRRLRKLSEQLLDLSSSRL